MPAKRRVPRVAPADDDAFLLDIQREAFDFFIREANPANGLIRDKTQPGVPASIASVGFGLSCYPIGVERGYLTRAAAAERTLTTLRFFRNSEQSEEPDATGWRGFYYHFLDMTTGCRAWQCELSTIDTSILIMGALTAAAYFDGDASAEAEIRAAADLLYRRMDWNWARNAGVTVSHGWKPETGFLFHRWQGYCEALILYALGLGSPTHPLPESSYGGWIAGYRWRKVYGHEYLYAGPLFIHQLSHGWIDFRKLQDDFMREHDSDYFENSRRATLVQQAYAIRNRKNFTGYGEDCWGITASDGPGAKVRTIGGRKRRFYDYIARGVPYGPDDGSVSPWAALTSLPFAPDLAIAAARHFHKLKLRSGNPYGFKATFNATYPHAAGNAGWISPSHFGINEGPLVLMIENHLSELPWMLTRRCEYIAAGLRRAGFRGGWLGQRPPAASP